MNRLPGGLDSPRFRFPPTPWRKATTGRRQRWKPSLRQSSRPPPIPRRLAIFAGKPLGASGAKAGSPFGIANTAGPGTPIGFSRRSQSLSILLTNQICASAKWPEGGRQMEVRHASCCWTTPSVGTPVAGRLRGPRGVGAGKTRMGNERDVTVVTGLGVSVRGVRTSPVLTVFAASRLTAGRGSAATFRARPPAGSKRNSPESRASG